ncbi:MAG: zinc ribbon domain-containing protein [Phycisphaeraceae bacterium]
MPTYEYYCPANRRTLEVMHAMSRRVSTWGELCALADAEPGSIDPDEPVEKLLSAGMIVRGEKQPDLDCGAPGGCCGGGCAMP